jgi:hypothetical protein
MSAMLTAYSYGIKQDIHGPNTSSTPMTAQSRAGLDYA